MANDPADFDGDGRVSAMDAIAALNRIGYVRNSGVVQLPVSNSVAMASVAAPTEPPHVFDWWASPLAPDNEDDDIDILTLLLTI